MRVSSAFVAAVVGGLVGVAAPAGAQPAAKPTTLLQTDLTSGKKSKIDGGGSSFDSELDAALGGPQAFSTQELEKIENNIKRELQRDRPRATPRLIVFLYPGKVTVEKLRSMTEIFVDIQLVMDPCERTVCKEAVARHIELVGRAVGSPTLQAPGHKLTWKNLSLETSVRMHDNELTVYKVPIADCIAASKRPGGGLAWLASMDKAEQDYEPIVQKAIAKHATARRVALVGAPQVTRGKGDVGVVMKVKGDRNRVQQQVIDAFAAAAEGLRENPKTPSQTQLELTLDVDGGRGSAPRRFRAPGNPVGLYVDRQLDGGALWSSYITEVKKQPGAASMAFDDAEASGRAPVGGEAGEPDDNQVISLLSSNFGAIGGCAKAEAAKSASFKGVTIVFKWTPDGKAAGVTTKEPQYKSGALAGCLKNAIESLRLPRFSGGAREIEYPIRLK
jgi:hypothetical protein